MRFVGDRRGQSVVIGTVILFGFLIVAMAVYQAQVVPQDNADVEFEHSQSVEGDFVDLRNAITGAGTVGDGRSTSVQLGTRYPQRTFFVNPPPATGELSTSDSGYLRIENANVDADGNAGEYWSAAENELNFSTRSVRYSPNYNEFRNGPDLVYEHSLVAAEFDDAVLARTGQTLVDGDRISLTTINGTVSESGVDRRSIDPKPRSQSQRTVTLERQGGADSIVVVLPTSVPEGEQRDALADEWDDRLNEDGEATATAEGIRLEIAQDEYALRLSSVGFSGSEPVGAAYITAVGDRTVTPGDRVTAEVRDEFNNPVHGVTVTVDETGEERQTDAEGRVNVNAADAGESRTLQIRDGDGYESVTFNSSVDEGGATETRTFNVEWPDSSKVVRPGGEPITVQVTDRDSGTAIERANVNVSTAVISGSGPSDIIFEPVTDEDGEVNVTLDVDENNDGDEFVLYASAGDDVDRLHVIIDSDDDDGEPTPPTVQNGIQYEGGLTSTETNSAIEFDIRNTGDDFARVQSIRVDSQIDEATQLYNGENERVIEITGGDSDAWITTEGGGNPTSRAIAADGTSRDLPGNAVLSTSGGGQDATVSVKQFGSASGSEFNQYEFGTLNRVTEEDDWDIEIVLELQDRDDVTFYFEE